MKPVTAAAVPKYLSENTHMYKNRIKINTNNQKSSVVLFYDVATTERDGN